MRVRPDGPWLELSQQLRGTTAYRRLQERLGPVARLPTAAAAWAVRLLVEDQGRGALVVVPQESEALRWVEAARLVGGEGAALDTVYFPTPALTPYQEVEPSLMVRAQEGRALDCLLEAELPTVVCTARALFQYLPTAEELGRRVVEIRAGAEHPIEALAAHLLENGYRRTDLVTEVGLFAVRGGIFDFFPPGEMLPIRLDLFGDTVESILQFDPVSQRSAEALDAVRVLPLSIHRSGCGEAELLARKLAAELGEGVTGEAAERLATLARGEGFPGWENYLGMIRENPSSLANLIDPNPVVVVVDGDSLLTQVRRHGELLTEEFHSRRDQRRLAVAPERLLVSATEVESLLDGADVEIGPLVEKSLDAAVLDFGATPTEIFHGQLPRFPREVETARARGERLILVSPPEHHPRLKELLAESAESGAVELAAGELERGFRWPLLSLALYGEAQLYPRRAAPRSGRRANPFFSGLRDLKVGEFVVHEDHGIGQFVGMRLLEGNGNDGATAPPSVQTLGSNSRADVEVMEIAYAGGRVLLLPLERLNQVQRYSGLEGAAPRLDKLGGSSWSRTKSRVKKGLRRLATDLLRLYAERKLAKAPAIPADSDAQAQFEAAFEHEETRDQLQAVAAIKKDLEQQQPMDRLLCGDVGFGKTEVAMRAAHKVVDGGYQVAVLAPTTILADQHLETFQRRFHETPVVVEMISRFRSAAQIKEVGARVAKGTVDILIGTHRLLSRDIEFANLGLLVVDEEQRFGVAQKERLKELRRDVHVLAMSATPVPRTLQLSLAGVRDMSLIESPPKDRMAVETRILPFTADLVREAIKYEVERSGQVYYVYNRVDTIEELVRYLRELLPGLRITVGHGQMDERELSRRMHAFNRGEYDLLVATTIIENGIDIPNVNTMIVHRADRFGLAQLYQLRGRVGRSNQLAYCYLLVPEDTVLSEDARKRLHALREFSDLGAGFRIAARDLEIRGAGNLLGAEQSGHITELGVETYLKMLEDTVSELRGEAPKERPSAHIELPVPTLIPSDYIGDTSLRMEIYRRLGAADEPPEEVLGELRDRFGPPPQQVETLVQIATLKRQAEELGVQSVALKGEKLILRLRRDARVDVDRLIRFVSDRDGASFSPSGVLSLAAVTPGDSLSVARHTLDVLSAAAEAAVEAGGR